MLPPRRQPSFLDFSDVKMVLNIYQKSDLKSSPRGVPPPRVRDLEGVDPAGKEKSPRAAAEVSSSSTRALPELSSNMLWITRPPLSAPRALQEASKLTFFGSRSLQERSKRPPRGFLRASASKMRFGSNFGPIFDSKKGPLDLKNQRNPLYCRRF